jgi:hypothetical protein
VLFVILGLALLYWARREPGGDLDDNTLNPSIGTTGERATDSEPRDLNQGGGDPASRPGSTKEEVEERGGR